MSNVSCSNCTSRVCTKKVPILKDLESIYLDEILDKVKHKQYTKGEVLFIEGDKACTLFFISSGKIKLYKYTKDGKEQIVHILSDGDFFGELDLLRNSEYGFSSKAIEEAEVCIFSKEEMRSLMMNNPKIAISLLENIGNRLAELENLAKNLATINIDSRMAYLVIDLMKKYADEVDSMSINLPLSREDMANYIGVTRETISRKLKKFEDERLIKLVGTKKIIVLDKEGLSDYI